MASITEQVSSFFNQFATRSTRVTRTLTVIGGLYALSKTFQVLQFLSFYSLPRNSLKRYITPSDSKDGDTWALVTGASDGIGVGFAEELCERGINVILHGRNEQKLQQVRDGLLTRWPSRQVQLLVFDASDVGTSEGFARLEAACNGSVRGVNLRMLINNVGGAPPPLWQTFGEKSYDKVGAEIDINARFHVEMTRLLLAQLQQNTPALVMTLGSGASKIATPYVSLYSGSKGFTATWSRCMRLEMKAEKQDVEFLYIQLGQVASGSTKRKASLLVPSPRTFAKSALDAVACGKSEVWSYWAHALQLGFIGSLPSWLADRLITKIALKEKAGRADQLRAQ